MSTSEEEIETNGRKEDLRKLLCPLWLKPESALWYAHELTAVRKILGTAFEGPSLEFGCMDGVNTFLLLGGEFAPEFDVYTEVRWTTQSHVWHSLKDDYFDTHRPDHLGQVDVLRRPSAKLDVGLSWKSAHLAKAARLGIYEQTVEQDPNLPLEQFGANAFATIWAPNLYWVENLDGLLKELSRILKPGGRIVTIFPDTSQLNHLLFRYAEQTNPAWMKDLDRGRYGNAARQARNLEQWTETFAGAGLRVSRYERFLPSLVGRVYDIGLRPMFPVFMDIYETLRQKAPEDWLRIKEQWIATAYHFLSPMCETAWMDRMGMEKVWFVFEVTR